MDELSSRQPWWWALALTGLAGAVIAFACPDPAGVVVPPVGSGDDPQATYATVAPNDGIISRAQSLVDVDIVQGITRADGELFGDWAVKRALNGCSERLSSEELWWASTGNWPNRAVVLSVYPLNRQCISLEEWGDYGIASIEEDGRVTPLQHPSYDHLGSSSWLDDFLAGEPAWPDPHDATQPEGRE